jgi:hypothetical protein
MRGQGSMPKQTSVVENREAWAAILYIRSLQAKLPVAPPPETGTPTAPAPTDESAPDQQAPTEEPAPADQPTPAPAPAPPEPKLAPTPTTDSEGGQP